MIAVGAGQGRATEMNLYSCMITQCMHVCQLFETKAGAEWRQSKVETSTFFTSKEGDNLIEQVEVSPMNRNMSNSVRINLFVSLSAS